MRLVARPRAVVFDLDGTLVDSAPEISASLNAALDEVGLAPFPVEEVHAFIGGGALAAINRALVARGTTLPEAQLDAMLARFLDVYAVVSAEGRGLYPGVMQLLDALRAAGVPLGLCTNKAQHITDIALRALGIDRYFGSIIGARDDLPKKPAADMLLKALGELGVSPAEALMVGDSSADVGCARAAGCPVVAVAYGYARGPVGELGADGVVASLDELRSAIAAARGA